MKKRYKIGDFLNNADPENFSFGIIASGQEMLKIFKRYYYDRVFVDCDTDAENSTVDTALACFEDLYKEFQERRLQNYMRIYDMMLMEYNPLENYDRLEEGSIIRSKEYGEKVTSSVDTKRNESTSTPKVEITAENFVVGYNEDTPHLSGKTVTKANGSDTINDKIVSQNSGGETYTEQTHTDTETESRNGFRVHGNVGVTTPAQMIMGELGIRERYDLVKAIATTFIDDVTFYC